MGEKYTTGPLRRAITLAERHADGLADTHKLRASELAARVEMLSGDWLCSESESVHQLAGQTFGASQAERHLGFIVPFTDPMLTHALVQLFRDVFANPFRPVAFSPEWQTFTTISIAKLMYDSRDFSAMPILADALQDAGCDNDDILTHCRGAGPHVRGCWLVDAVLGKN